MFKKSIYILCFSLISFGFIHGSEQLDTVFSPKISTATVSEKVKVAPAKSQQIGQLQRLLVQKNIPFENKHDDFHVEPFKLSLQSSSNLNKGGESRLLASYFTFTSVASPLSSSATNSGLSLVKKQTEVEDEDVDPELVSGPYNFPNPFVLTEGTTIGYRLSKDMDIRIRIYNMLGSKIFDQMYPASSDGGKKGYNKLSINHDTFNGEQLSAGVYFYYLSFNDQIIGQSKLAIIPSGDDS